MTRTADRGPRRAAVRTMNGVAEYWKRLRATGDRRGRVRRPHERYRNADPPLEHLLERYLEEHVEAFVFIEG